MAYESFPLHLPLEYTNGKDLRVLYDINVGSNERLKVVGQPEFGSYEWLIERADGTLLYSDCGYGCADYALRDGLIVWHGAYSNSDDVLQPKIDQIMRSARVNQQGYRRYSRMTS